MKSVSEVARLSGCSVRTLHHYDAIGLLKPTQVTQSGYRLYDQQALKRLNAILLFRQLQFPLKQIRQILDTPGLDLDKALEDQIHMLELQRQKLDRIISHAKKMQENGGFDMDFSAYSDKELERYSREARERWGSTDAYKEYAQRSQGRSAQQEQDAGQALMDIFRELGALRGSAPEDAAVQALVEKLRGFITAHYYTCTPQILRGLGEMYAAGGEMNDNIDKAGGEGTGRFAREAIAAYCRGKL